MKFFRKTLRSNLNRKLHFLSSKTEVNSIQIVKMWTWQKPIFFNYQLVNIRNVSNRNFNACVNSMNKSGSHFQNLGANEYHTDWSKMRLTNAFALLIISLLLRLVMMLTNNSSYLMIIMITMMTISLLLLSRNILTGTIFISMIVFAWLRLQNRKNPNRVPVVQFNIDSRRNEVTSPSMRHRSDVSFRSHIGWDVADHAYTSSRYRNWYVNETDLFETS